MDLAIVALIVLSVAFFILTVITALIGWFVLDLNKRFYQLHGKLIMDGVLNYESEGTTEEDAN